MRKVAKGHVHASELQKFTPKHTHSSALRRKERIRTYVAEESTRTVDATTLPAHTCGFFGGCDATVRREGARCGRHGGASRPTPTFRNTTLPFDPREGGNGVTRTDSRKVAR